MKKLYFLAFFLLLACSSKPTNENVAFQPALQMSNQLFGLLEQKDGQFYFVKFQTMAPKGQSQSPWVNLKTHKPYWKTKAARCGHGIAKGNKVPSCDDVYREDLFFEKDFDEKNGAARVLGAVLTMGTSLAGVNYDITFNEKKFQQAYLGAINSSGVDTLHAFDLALSALQSEKTSTINRYLSNISTAKLHLSVAVDDQSGLFSNEFSFMQFVKTSPNELQAIPEFSADSANELLMTVRNTASDLLQKWDDQTSYAGVKCHSYKEFQGYAFQFSCPATLTFKGNRFDEELSVQVASLAHHRTLPDEFELKDDIVRLDFDGISIGLANLSNTFLFVDSIAFYYANEIAQKQSLSIELSPVASLKMEDRILLKDFPINWKSLSFTDITKNSARKVNVKYGFALKYRVIDTGKENTIFLTKDFPLLGLIGKG